MTGLLLTGMFNLNKNVNFRKSYASTGQPHYNAMRLTDTDSVINETVL